MGKLRLERRRNKIQIQDQKFMLKDWKMPKCPKIGVGIIKL